MSTMLETIICKSSTHRMSWTNQAVDEGWVYLPGYTRPTVQKLDGDCKKRFKTDAEALEHVMTSDSEPCRECRDQLIRNLFL